MANFSQDKTPASNLISFYSSPFSNQDSSSSSNVNRFKSFAQGDESNMSLLPEAPKAPAQKPIAVNRFDNAKTDLAKTQQVLSASGTPSMQASRGASQIISQPDVTPIVPAVKDEKPSLREQIQSNLLSQVDGTAKAERAAERERKSEELDLAEKTTRSNRLKNELTGMRIQFEEDLEEVEKNKSGVFGPSALNSQANRLRTDYNRNSVRKQLEYHMANEDAISAQNTLNTYMSDLQTDIQNQNQIFQTLMSLEQNDMTESEKLQATQAFQEKQAAIAFQNQKDLASFNSQLRTNEMYVSSGIEDARASIEEQQIAETEKTAILGNLSLINDIVNSDYLDQVVGLKNPLTYWTPGSNEQLVKNQLRQLNASLSLDARQKLKGSGTISDFEAKTLANSVSALGGNLSNTATRSQLVSLQGAFRNAAGLPTPVEIRDPSTGRSQVVNATREGINSALADGLEVTYK
jgi:hypothetical protein